MNAFDRLGYSIPLEDASSFFIKVKTAAVTDPPDETGMLEGEFEAPVEEVIGVMKELVENEFKTMMAYHVYANSLRDLAHSSIAEEFEEHAEKELEHANYLLRRMSVLGGPIQIGEIEPPPASSEAVDIIHTMIRYEQEGIAKWKILHSMMGENPSKYDIEQFLTNELHHLDELWQLLPQEAHQPVLQGKAIPGMPGDPMAQPMAAPVEPASPEGIPAPTEVAGKTAAMKMRFSLALHKLADGEVGGAATEGAQMTAPTPAKTMPTNYLAAEQMAQQAQDTNESTFYRQQLETQKLQAQATQQQVEQQTQQLAEMQNQVAVSGTEAQAASQQALQSQQEATQSAQLSANMRLGLERMRTQLMDLAAQDPSTPQTPVQGQSMQQQQVDQAAEAGDPNAVAQQQANQGMALDPGTAQSGVDSGIGGESSGGTGGSQGPAVAAEGAQGAPGAAPPAGAAPQNANATGTPPTAEGAKPATNLSVKVSSEKRAFTTMKAEGFLPRAAQLLSGRRARALKHELANTPHIAGHDFVAGKSYNNRADIEDLARRGEEEATKVLASRVGAAATAGAASVAAHKASKKNVGKKKESSELTDAAREKIKSTSIAPAAKKPDAEAKHAGAAGAAIGATLGGVGGYMESRHADPAADAQRVQGLEAGDHSTFGGALALAKAKMRQSMSELSAAHPVAATATGAALGGLTGHQVQKQMPKMLQDAQELRS